MPNIGARVLNKPVIGLVERLHFLKKPVSNTVVAEKPVNLFCFICGIVYFY